MVFLLSIRQCRFYREEWTTGRRGLGSKKYVVPRSSRPRLRSRNFNQTLKKTKQRAKKPSSHAGYQGVYRFDMKGFENPPQDKTFGRPFYSECAHTIIKQGFTHFPMNVPMQNIPSTDNRLDRKIEIRLKGKTERFYYTVTDTKGRSNVGFVKPLCFKMK